jgi:putative FmdB family regulatory protein
MTYEYLCTSCGHAWEAEQRISAEPLRDCPDCGKATARRQVSGGMGFILKGGGWYADGYASGGKKTGGGSIPAPAEGTKPKAPDSGSGSGGSTAAPATSAPT